MLCYALSLSLSLCMCAHVVARQPCLLGCKVGVWHVCLLPVMLCRHITMLPQKTMAMPDRHTYILLFEQ